MRHASHRPSPLLTRRFALGSAFTLTLAAGGGWLWHVHRPRTTPTPPSAAPMRTSTTPASLSASPSPSTSTDPIAHWSLEQVAGQLLMVGIPADGSPDTLIPLLTDRHVGGVFLAGRSTAGIHTTHSLVEALTASARDSGHTIPLLVSTDQEGGNVQVLSGPGVTQIPDATVQGSWTASDLTAAATTWAQELSAAGVTMNLAPVADLVDLPDPASNAPIGYWSRHMGTDPDTVFTHVTAFCEGMRAGGVIPVVKHFPGLGRTRDNTDVATAVTDTVTQPGDAAVGVFARTINAGTPVVMVSSAIYTHIDPNTPAVFSVPVVTDLLRGQLGFEGIAITDDVAAASQVAAWSPAERAVLAVRAGIDIVLASADDSVAPAMLDALIAEGEADPAMADLMRRACRRVLALKATYLAVG